MTVPRYQPHTWRGRREPALSYETQHHSILNRLRLSAKRVAEGNNLEHKQRKQETITKCLDRIF